ncbi:STAS domain-containing protein [Maledivibacter halophilus]|uniref:Anti-sigma factor antagonist n=1 Tax=Maledivibacter halophilus TaxID=36842 RepID=A0A1T5MKX8_9FIRM|nr:STAS domain-containing protein [Maledivibacter halophilus]SKC88846.1 anti-sigma B factor antagonist [Maledivibacter halophilus]
MSLNINKTFNNEKNLWEVKLMGEVDIYNANNLKENLNNLLQEKETDIELDCEELEYIDSTGLGVLIGILKKLKNIEKNIIISNPKPNMSKLLRITGLDQIFVMK